MVQLGCANFTRACAGWLAKILPMMIESWSWKNRNLDLTVTCSHALGPPTIFRAPKAREGNSALSYMRIGRMPVIVLPLAAPRKRKNNWQAVFSQFERKTNVLHNSESID
jgi:hypothetical protein